MVNMSRIGKKPILIPENVEVKIDGQEITVKGPKGQLSYKIRPEIEVGVKQGKIIVLARKETESKAGASSLRGKKTKAFWGLTRALLANMVSGVVEGYQKKLEIQGVGYRAKLEGDTLVLMVGFSHLVKIEKPEGIEFSVEKNIITVSGIDKARVGEIAAKIRAVRPPEPYKGKGIRYLGEVVRRKEGKKAASTE